MIAATVAFVFVTVFEVVRYHGLSEEEQAIYLFTLNSMVACCTIPAVPVGIIVFLYFLFRTDPERPRVE